MRKGGASSAWLACHGMSATSHGGRVRVQRQGAGGRGHGAATAAVAVIAAALALCGCGTSLGASPTTTRPTRAAPGAAPFPVAVGSEGIRRTAAAPAHRRLNSVPEPDQRRTDGDGSRAEGSGSPPAFYRIASPLSPAPPGSIIRSEMIASAGQLPPGTTAYRVIYHSESITGADIPVSGMIVVPGGTPPADGFPIVSYAHGTTGIASQCAPSLDGFGAIPYLATLIEDRMIVVATDYQGLGVPGIHPYLVGQSEAQGVLDAARAARNLEGSAASNTVAVIGYSQGGQAALFAGQIAQAYAPELYLAGVVAVAPYASLTELVPAVPKSRPDPDAGFAAMALDAWSSTYGDLPLDTVLTKAALNHAASMASACSDAVAAAFDGAPADLLFRPGWSGNPVVRADDAANQPGRSPISAPVLVVQGTADVLIPYADTTSLVTDGLCRGQHDTVRYVSITGAGHDGALQDGQTIITQWITRRMAGSPATDSCPGLDRSTPG
jgi:pimeloyl-ACP methyl ester carboxylesterase